MPPRKRVTAITTEEMLAQLAEGVKQQARKPNVFGYKPHAKQREFHSSTAKKRLYIGGNRSGKTTAGVVEGIWYARGVHPFKRVYEPPVQLRVIGVDFKRGIKSILLPQYKRWLPPSMLKNGSWDRSYDNDANVLTLLNGSTIEFMSYEQETDKFSGVPRHGVHYDEEPPFHIYDESQARLIDYDGDAWFTMTPVEGMTWVYDELYLPAVENENSKIHVVEAHMSDNPYINQSGVANFIEGLGSREDAKTQRESGKFIALGGLVFKSFSPERHVASYKGPPPKEWEWYASMDHGFNAPTAWLWHAVSPDGNVVTFWEEYANDKIVKDWAEIYHKVNKGFGKIPEITVGDPAIKQRQAVTGTSIQTEYGNHGVYIMPGNNDVIIGVNQMQKYLTVNPDTSKPYWQITENCPNLIREMKRLRWKTYAGRKAQFENNPQEQIHKKDDHATDSARYFFTCLPDLTPIIQAHEEKIQLEQGPVLRYDEALAQALSRDQAHTEWKVHEGTDLYALESD